MKYAEKIMIMVMLIVMVTTLFYPAVNGMPVNPTSASNKNATGSSNIYKMHGNRSYGPGAKAPELSLPPLPRAPAPEKVITNKPVKPVKLINDNIAPAVNIHGNNRDQKSVNNGYTDKNMLSSNDKSSYSPPPPATPPPITNLNGGTKYITTPTLGSIEYANGTVYLTDNLTVLSGVTVIFAGVKLYVNGSYSQATLKTSATIYGNITVDTGGVLNLTYWTYEPFPVNKPSVTLTRLTTVQNNASFKVLNPSLSLHTVSVDYNISVSGTLNVNGSTNITNIGYDGKTPSTYGLYIAKGSTTSITNATFYNGYYDIYALNTVPSVSDSYFNNSVHGVNITVSATKNLGLYAVFNNLKFNNDTYSLNATNTGSSKIQNIELNITGSEFYTSGSSFLPYFITVTNFTLVNGSITGNTFNDQNNKYSSTATSASLVNIISGQTALYNIVNNRFTLNQSVSLNNYLLPVFSIVSNAIGSNVYLGNVSKNVMNASYFNNNLYYGFIYSATGSYGKGVLATFTNNSFNASNLLVFTVAYLNQTINLFTNNIQYCVNGALDNLYIYQYSSVGTLSINNFTFNRIISTTTGSPYDIFITSENINNITVTTFGWNRIITQPYSTITSFMFYIYTDNNFVTNISVGNIIYNVLNGGSFLSMFIIYANVYLFKIGTVDYNKLTASTGGSIWGFYYSPQTSTYIGKRFSINSFNNNYINGTYLEDILDFTNMQNITVNTISYNSYIGSQGNDITSFGYILNASIGSITDNTVYIAQLQNFTNIMGYYGIKNTHGIPGHVYINNINNNYVESNVSLTNFTFILSNYTTVNNTLSNTFKVNYLNYAFMFVSANKTDMVGFNGNKITNVTKDIVSNSTALLYVNSAGNVSIKTITSNSIKELSSGDFIDIFSMSKYSSITIDNISSNVASTYSVVNYLSTPASRMFGNMVMIFVFSYGYTNVTYISGNNIDISSNGAPYGGVVIFSIYHDISISTIGYNVITGGIIGFYVASINDERVTVNSIVNNTISNDTFGIFLYSHTYSTYGILPKSMTVGNIDNNSLSNTHYGIYFYADNNINVTNMNNNLFSNTTYGAYFFAGNNINVSTIEKNIVYTSNILTDYGIYLAASNNVTITTISKNSQLSSYGVAYLSPNSPRSYGVAQSASYFISIYGYNSTVGTITYNRMSDIGTWLYMSCVGYILIKQITNNLINGLGSGLSGYGVYLTAESLTVDNMANNTISSFVQGLYASAGTAGSLYLYADTVNGSSYAIEVTNINFTGTSLNIYNNQYGIDSYEGVIGVYRSVIYNNSYYGIYGDYGTLHVNNNSFYNNYGSVYAQNGLIYIDLTTVYNSTYGMYLYNEKGYINNDTVSSTVVGLYSRGSRVIVTDDSFINIYNRYVNIYYTAGAIIGYSSYITIYNGYFTTINGYGIYGDSVSNINWIITASVGNGISYMNHVTSIYIPGNITVESGGSWYITNVSSITFEESWFNIYGISIKNTDKSSYMGYISDISSANEPFYFNVYGSLKMVYSTVSGASDIGMYSNMATIEYSIVEQSYFWGIVIQSSTPVLIGDNIQFNRYYGGILVNNTYGIHMTGVSFSNNYNGLVLENSYVIGNGFQFTGNTYGGIYSIKSTLITNSTTINEEMIGVDLVNSTGTFNSMVAHDVGTVLISKSSTIYSTGDVIEANVNLFIEGNSSTIYISNSVSAGISTAYFVLSGGTVAYSLNNTFAAPSYIYDTSKLYVEGYENILVKTSNNTGYGGVNVTLTSGTYIEKGMTSTGGQINNLFVIEYVMTSTSSNLVESRATLYDGVVTYNVSFYGYIINPLVVVMKVPPSFTTVPLTTQVVANSSYIYNFTVNDPFTAYGDSLTFNLLNAPAGMSILKTSKNNGEIKWTPGLDQVGTWTFTIMATNLYGQQGFQTIALTVLNTQIAPEITSTPSSTASVGSTYLYQVKASNNAYGNLQYSLLAAPAGMNINSKTGLITWVPDSSEVGTNYVSLMAESSNGLYAVQTFTVNVSLYSNIAYISSSVTPYNSTAGPYTITLSVSDSPGVSISSAIVYINGVPYTMTQQSGVPGGVYTFSYALNLTAGSYVYSFKVTDSTGSSKTLAGGAVTVKAIPAVPVAKPNYLEDSLIVLTIITVIAMIVAIIIMALYILNRRKGKGEPYITGKTQSGTAYNTLTSYDKGKMAVPPADITEAKSMQPEKEMPVTGGTLAAAEIYGATESKKETKEDKKEGGLFSSMFGKKEDKKAASPQKPPVNAQNDAKARDVMAAEEFRQEIALSKKIKEKEPWENAKEKSVQDTVAKKPEEKQGTPDSVTGADNKSDSVDKDKSEVKEDKKPVPKTPWG